MKKKKVDDHELFVIILKMALIQAKKINMTSTEVARFLIYVAREIRDEDG